MRKIKNLLVKEFLIDVVAGIFLMAGLWTISHGAVGIYDSFYKSHSIPPSVLGDSLFWFIEGIFFLYLAIEIRKYRKIKLG